MASSSLESTRPSAVHDGSWPKVNGFTVVVNRLVKYGLARSADDDARGAPVAEQPTSTTDAVTAATISGHDARVRHGGTGRRSHPQR